MNRQKLQEDLAATELEHPRMLGEKKNNPKSTLTDLVDELWKDSVYKVIDKQGDNIKCLTKSDWK